jgi:hypothetical protein
VLVILKQPAGAVGFVVAIVPDAARFGGDHPAVDRGDGVVGDGADVFVAMFVRAG